MTVVSPARSSRTWIALILCKAVLRRLAQICNVDHRSQEAVRSAGQPTVGGAGVKASVVSPGRSAVTRQREGHDGPSLSLSAVLAEIASRAFRALRGHCWHFQVLMPRRNIPLAREAEDPEPVESLGADD